MAVHRWLVLLTFFNIATVAAALVAPDHQTRVGMTFAWLGSIGAMIVVMRKLPFIIPEGEKFHNYLHNKLQEEAKNLLGKIEVLERNATTDPLTGLLNRRGGEEAVSRNIARSRRKKLALSLLILDIDDFKQVNDTFGHAIGDLVLAKVAEVMRNHLRASDVIIRWGGEEIIAILPDADIEGAVTVAHKLRLSILSIILPNNLRVTASFGCAEIDGGSFERALEIADQRLYQAKSQGKNTVRPRSEKILLDSTSTRT